MSFEKHKTNRVTGKLTPNMKIDYGTKKSEDPDAMRAKSGETRKAPRLGLGSNKSEKPIGLAARIKFSNKH